MKVIDDPIVTDAEFARVQAMLAAKREHHWKARQVNESRFTYHGFLSCSSCGKPEYTRTYTSQKSGLISDYYVCSSKGAYISNRKNPIAAIDRCSTAFMRREKLEAHLDEVFATRLTDRQFLQSLADEFETRGKGGKSEKKIARLEAQLGKLDEKRQRILDGYFEGVISRDDRDVRITVVDRDRAIVMTALEEEVPNHTGLDTEQLVALFRPLFAWRTMHTESKRRILYSLIPEIRVANYLVAGVNLIVPSLQGENLKRKPPTGDRGLNSDRQSFGYYANRRTTALDIAEPSSRLYIPLNL